MDGSQRWTAGIALGALLLGPTIVAGGPAQADPGTIVVTTLEDSGPGSLRAAIEQANASPADDTITFAPGVAGTITLTSGQLDVNVGPGSGDLTLQGPGDDVVTIDAQRHSRVLAVVGAAGDAPGTLTLSGLTVSNGKAEDDEWDGDGGGIDVQAASLEVSESTLSHNDGGYEGDGGAVHLDAAGASGLSVSVTDSTVADNVAGLQGGGIAVEGAAPLTVTRSVVLHNAAFSYSGYDGSALGFGGGIAAPDVTVVGSRVSTNAAGERGGGIWGAHVTVVRSTLDHNGARQEGGGLSVEPAYGETSGELHLSSSTVTADRARQGGAVFIAGATTAQVTASTLADNQALVSTGGIATGVQDGAWPEVSLASSVVAMNAQGDLGPAPQTFSVDHSLVQDPDEGTIVTPGGSIFGRDPLLAPLPEDPTALDAVMVPASNSPVVDRGKADGETTDQRGAPRPVDDPQVADALDGTDIGAVELTAQEQQSLPQLASVTRPTITPTHPAIGDTVTTTGGTWAGTDVTLSYQWYAAGEPIPGATSSSYVIDGSVWGPGTADTAGAYDGGPVVTVRVTASAPGHRDAVVTSDPTAGLVRGTPTGGRPATIRGTLKIGSDLTPRTHAGSWSPRPDQVTTWWRVGGRLVHSGGPHLTLHVRKWMKGKTITLGVRYESPLGWKNPPISRVRRHWPS